MSATAEPLTLEGASGNRISADAYGHHDAPPVVLLHGGGQTRHAWTATAQRLASHGYRAVCVDARGHGDSDWDAEQRYELEWFARDLIRVARALGRPPTLVGASLGGSSSLLAVGSLGLEARALVLVDIAPQIEPEGVRRIVAFMTAHPNGFASLQQAADAVADYLEHRERPSDHSGLEKNLRRGSDGRYRWHWDPSFLDRVRGPRGVEHREHISEAARRLDLPVLLVRGRLSDLLSEEGAQHFLQLVPHAEYADVSGAAHMVAGDRNDRFCQAVLDFLAKADPAS
jgi:non-heme chloroperoxidase